MKSNLKFNLLQHFLRKKEEGGFTLIELLVVIIIIGILAAIALPSFLNQAARARETEAQTNLGAINRGQQAFLLEYGFFAHADSGADVDGDGTDETGLEALDVGIGELEAGGTVITDFYEYDITSTGQATTVAEATADPATGTNGDITIRAFRGCVDINGETELAKSEKPDGAFPAVPACANVTP